MSNTYFLASYFPPLSLDAKPELNLAEIDVLLKMNLSHSDFKQTKLLRLYFDIENIRNFLRKTEIDFRGRLTESEIEEGILSKSEFPPFVLDWLDKWSHDSERLKYFNELWFRFFEYVDSQANGFLKDYFRLERDLMLIMAALRAKKYGLDLNKELQFEDSNRSPIPEILAQKEARHFEPPSGYEELRAILENEPMYIHRALIEYKLKKIDEQIGLDVFSIDAIMAYLAKLFIVDGFFRLDREKGNNVLDKIEKGSL